MSGDSLAMIMAASGGTAVAAAYQPPPSPPLQDVLANPPRNSIVTGRCATPLLAYPDEDFRFGQTNRRLYNRRSGRKQEQKKAARAADLKDDMDKYVASPLAVSKFDPNVFLDGFVFDNTPTYGQEVSEQPFWSNFEQKQGNDKSHDKSGQSSGLDFQHGYDWLQNEDSQNDDCFWSKTAQKHNDHWSQNEGCRWPRSVETSPASSVSAVSPIGTSPVWAPPDDSPLDLSGLSALFQSLRPTC